LATFDLGHDGSEQHGVLLAPDLEVLFGEHTVLQRDARGSGCVGAGEVGEDRLAGLFGFGLGFVEVGQPTTILKPGVGLHLGVVRRHLLLVVGALRSQLGCEQGQQRDEREAPLGQQSHWFSSRGKAPTWRRNDAAYPQVPPTMQPADQSRNRYGTPGTSRPKPAADAAAWVAILIADNTLCAFRKITYIHDAGVWEHCYLL